MDEDLVPDSSAWQLVPSLSVLPTDLRIQKEHPNAFYRTNLQAILTQRRVDQLEICGAQTEYCVDATIKDGPWPGLPGSDEARRCQHV
ncbi:isochorismatase family protein [uncultured Limosilactobacillus sp.]|uniref:isochorismatase family protein n=1 Tax=uncultured Limosilactobacillus sp. TaxID=2837629 RepID=UPI00338ED146